jgi:hypothetical protein
MERGRIAYKILMGKPLEKQPLKDRDVGDERIQ